MGQVVTPGPVPVFQRVSLARHPGALTDAFLLPFTSDSGDASSFARHGIACPPSIERSVGKRRAEYLAGRRVAVAALCEAGANVSDIAISASRAPCWPEGYIGSITHADGLAAAVAMRARASRGVGIDIEHVVTASAMEAIAGMVVDTGERRALQGLAAHVGWPMAFTVAFSAKESFYKATAATVGRIFDFTALHILGTSFDDGSIAVEIAEPLASTLPTGLRLQLGFGLLTETSIITSCDWRSTLAEVG